MANLVEFLVKVKDLASSPLAKMGATGGRSFSQLEQGVTKLSSRFGGLKMSISDIDKKLNDLRKTREISVDSRQIRRINSELDVLEKRKARLEGTGRAGSGISMMGLAGAGMAIYGSLAGAGAILKSGMDREQTNLAFTTMLGGDANRSKALLGNMNQFANATPFTNNEVISSGRSLLAYGFDENKILPSLKRVGDVASGLKIPFGELSEIYGKANVQGTLYAEDLNQLAGRGIPIFTELAKVMGVKADQVKKLGSEGKITFPMMEQAFTNMTSKGGMFENMMQKQSETAGGKWSTMMGVAQTKLADFSESLLPVTTGLIEFGTWALNNTTTILSLAGGLMVGATAYKAISLGTKLWSASTRAATLAQWGLNTAMLANPITWVAVGIAALAAGVIYCWNTFEGFRGTLFGLWESFKQVFSNIGSFFKSVFSPVMDALNAFQNPNLSTWEKTKAIGASMVQMGFNLTPAGMAYNGISFAADGGFTNGVADAYGKGKAAGIANFRESKGTHSKGLLSFFGGKGANEVEGGGVGLGAGALTVPASAKDTAHGISGGGVRNMTINVSKFFDDIHIHAASAEAGINDLEKRMMEVMMRVANSGGAVVR